MPKQSIIGGFYWEDSSSVEAPMPSTALKLGLGSEHYSAVLLKTVTHLRLCVEYHRYHGRLELILLGKRLPRTSVLEDALRSYMVEKSVNIKSG